MSARSDRLRHVHRRACLLAGLGLAAGAAPALAQPAAAAIGDAVALPPLRLLDGRLLAPAALRDTALVLVFFTTDCPYCRRHNAHVDQLAQASRGRALRVIGVAGDRDPEAVRAYLQRNGYRFDVAMDDGGALRARLTARRVVPMTCVLDRGGRLREVIPGEMAEADVMALARWGSAG